MSKHTPGPWRIELCLTKDERPVGAKIIAPAGEKHGWATAFVNLDEDATEPHGQLSADASLIAAAPDLLAALMQLQVEMCDHCQGEGLDCNICEGVGENVVGGPDSKELRAAIKKAMSSFDFAEWRTEFK